MSVTLFHSPLLFVRVLSRSWLALPILSTGRPSSRTTSWLHNCRVALPSLRTLRREHDTRQYSRTSPVNTVLPYYKRLNYSVRRKAHPQGKGELKVNSSRTTFQTGARRGTLKLAPAARWCDSPRLSRTRAFVDRFIGIVSGGGPAPNNPDPN